MNNSSILQGGSLLLHDGVINSWRSYKFVPFLFFLFISCRYRCALLSESMSLRLINSISSGIYLQNTQFHMYTTTSKQHKDFTFKNSHPNIVYNNCYDFFYLTNNRLPHDICSISFSPGFWENNMTVKMRSMRICWSVDACGIKARMDTYSLDCFDGSSARA